MNNNQKLTYSSRRKLLDVFLIFALLSVAVLSKAQTFSSNSNPVGLEHNLLFKADERFTVVQTPANSLDASRLFDGRLSPQNVTITTSQPYTIHISGLPEQHVQAGGWVGWSTRYQYPMEFEILGLETYSANDWITIADYTDSTYSGREFAVQVPHGRYKELKFIFYESTHSGSNMQLSELYFIHPEATSPYMGLFVDAGEGPWEIDNGTVYVTGNDAVYDDFDSYSGITLNNYLPNGKVPTLVIDEEISGTKTPNGDTYKGGLSFGYGGAGIYSVNPNPHGSKYYGELRFHTTYWNSGNLNNADRMVIKRDGKVGIGTTTPSELLSVGGTINAEELLLEDVIGADFVFEEDYDLLSLEETEKFIKTNKHLPEIPSAAEMAEEGLSIKEMNILLLQKVEELTLHLIRHEKEMNTLKEENRELRNLVQADSKDH